jgi:sialic acid synthase SpsE
MSEFKIGGKIIGPDAPLYFVADIAANHDGDLERAYRLIELAKEAGADAAKFQNFRADKIVSRAGFDAMPQQSHQAKWKKSVFDVYADYSIAQDWTAKLKRKCDEVGIEYFSSPYDFESVDHVDPYVEVYKIGSGDVTWLEIVEHIASKGKPVLIATGACELDDVKRAMEVLMRRTDRIVLMQCNTNYTAETANFRFINLNVLNTYRKLWPHAVLGLSDHTHGHATVVGAVALGARVIEKHFTDDNGREGPDHKFAMNPKTWAEMVKAATECHLALGDGQKRIEENEKATAVVQRRSLWFTRALPAGHVLAAEDLFPLRPRREDGLAPFEKAGLIGKKLKRAVKADEYIRKEDVHA